MMSKIAAKQFAMLSSQNDDIPHREVANTRKSLVCPSCGLNPQSTNCYCGVLSVNGKRPNFIRPVHFSTLTQHFQTKLGPLVAIFLISSCLPVVCCIISFIFYARERERVFRLSWSVVAHNSQRLSM